MFENTTNASVKDCFLTNNLLLVIVNENNIAKAIGRGGSNIKNLERKFNKKIKIVEFNSNLTQFIKNLVNPIKVNDIKIENNIVQISVNGVREKAQLIGRESKNLHELKDIVSLYFDVQDIKIV